MYEQIMTFREPVLFSWFVSVLLLIWIIQPICIFFKFHLVCSDPHKFAIDVQWTKWLDPLWNPLSWTKSSRHPKSLLSPSFEPKSAPGFSQLLNVCCFETRASRDKQQCSCLSGSSVLKVAPPSLWPPWSGIQREKWRAKANVFTLWVFF